MKSILPKQIARGKKSGIVLVSSQLGEFPTTGMLAYSATKSFLTTLSLGLSIELKDKVDFLSFQCGSVKTDLNKDGLEDANVAVRGALRHVGRKTWTYGTG